MIRFYHSDSYKAQNTIYGAFIPTDHFARMNRLSDKFLSIESTNVILVCTFFPSFFIIYDLMAFFGKVFHFSLCACVCFVDFESSDAVDMDGKRMERELVRKRSNEMCGRVAEINERPIENGQ